jgi:diguanylate cyclase (GGDEF)-like protein
MWNPVSVRSSLLEHFARLAATVAGTRAAIIGILLRRSDPEPTLVPFGLTQNETAVIAKMDSILGVDPGLIIIPDLMRDQRFRSECAIDECPRLRFLGHLKLLSPGGVRVGFIAVVDETPRSGFTDTQLAALDNLAEMVVADRRREQRHLHLLHVANRALRVDKMLRLVADAPSCAEALTSLLGELCRFHDASGGLIFEAIRPDDTVVEISRYNKSDTPGEKPGSDPAMMVTAALTGAIRRNEPYAIRASQNVNTVEIGTEPTALSGNQVCVPIWVQRQRFGVILRFKDERPDLDSVVADIASLADTIRPTLHRKMTEERVRFVAHHDSLTQLANRLTFYNRLDDALAQTHRSGNGFAILCLDLDGFKAVNDTYGHESGDKLLVAVARRLKSIVRQEDTIARMGGDEFAIIQLSRTQPAAATALAKRLLRKISQPFDLDGRRPVIGVSIGIAIYPQDGETHDTLLRSADAALYEAKRSGRNSFRLFDAALQGRQIEQCFAEQELRSSLKEDRFVLEYQPICETSSLRIVGFEALVRWHHPSRGIIQPDQFIPLAESSGLITGLGQWVMQSACAGATAWPVPVWVSVNLSPVQFRQAKLPEQIAAVLRQTGLAPERLEIEVTEGLLLEESDLVLRVMEGLREQGIRITLDDFGTANASLSYLRRFPFNRIKIDKSFIQGICEDSSTLAIVEVILSMGDRLNLSVVAEGVETERELAALRKLGCRFVQGYLPGRPTSHDEACVRLQSITDRETGPLLRSNITITA